MKVLIVDDDKRSAEIVSRCLKEMMQSGNSLEITIETDIDTAVRIIDEGPPIDLVVIRHGIAPILKGTIILKHPKAKLIFILTQPDDSIRMTETQAVIIGNPLIDTTDFVAKLNSGLSHLGFSTL